MGFDREGLWDTPDDINELLAIGTGVLAWAGLVLMIFRQRLGLMVTGFAIISATILVLARIVRSLSKVVPLSRAEGFTTNRRNLSVWAGLTLTAAASILYIELAVVASLLIASWTMFTYLKSRHATTGLWDSLATVNKFVIDMALATTLVVAYFRPSILLVPIGLVITRFLWVLAPDSWNQKLVFMWKDKGRNKEVTSRVKA